MTFGEVMEAAEKPFGAMRNARRFHGSEPKEGSIG